MSERIWSILTLILFGFPVLAFASCSLSGTTVVYVNGIETTQQQANEDTTSLRHLVLPEVNVLTGYNPTHLNGLGDEIESISQAFNAPISNYDLNTILAQIASEVATRKILLVGHSQGSFYTNEIYDYLTKNGAPKDSIGVYNIGTPASFVAGGGRYLTSVNDKVINAVRQLDQEWHAPQALMANISIPEESGYAQRAWGGHAPSVYFSGASQRIAADIQETIGKLSSASGTSGSCIEPPSLGVSYDIQKAAFGIADPFVSRSEYMAADARNTIVSIANNTNDILNTALSDAIFSVIPRPTVQNAAGVFAVEKALYGSSLSVADYEALLKGEDIPEVAPPPEPQKSAAQKTIAPSEQKEETPAQRPVEQATTTPPAMVQQPSAATPMPPTIPIPSLIPVQISPGYGGGAPAQIIESIAAAPAGSTAAAPNSPPDPATASTSSGQVDTQSATSTDQTNTATSSPATSMPPTESSGATVTASSTTSVASTTLEQDLSLSPLTDSFDTGVAEWNKYASDWSVPDWSTSTADCYSGNCLSETVRNQQYEGIKIGTPLASGSFIVHFRSDLYTGGYGVGVCTTADPSQCESSSSIGGENALTSYLLDSYYNDTWHYLYFAFRDGAAGYKEYCDLVDDKDPQDCSWGTPYSSSTIPNGTKYSGIFLYTGNGLNRGSSFYWDDLTGG